MTQVKKDNEPIILTQRESMQLLDLIENPPPRNQKFLAAQARWAELNREASKTTAS